MSVMRIGALVAHGSQQSATLLVALALRWLQPFVIALGPLVIVPAACQPVAEPSDLTPDCPSGSSGGVTSPLRRLSGFELVRSLSELSGVDPTELQPPLDEPGLGFDNNALTFSVSESHAERYYALAAQATNALLGNTTLVQHYAGCGALADHSCRRRLLEGFGLRAFRRPLSDEEIAAFESLVNPATDAVTGVSIMISTLLQSPQFLYRVEAPAAGAPVSNAYALASRLSYLLVSAPPDDELLAAADAGDLERVDVLQAQAGRLLADARSTEMFRHFVQQWWELDRFSAVEKDRSLYRTWSENVRSAMQKETSLFIDDLWTREPTLGQLLASRHTFVNPTLAGFYGVLPPDGPGFSRVLLDRERASGLLTHGAFLASHARADQTSPVLRGKFVRDRLLCAPPPPPPPNIAVRPPVVDPRLSTRQRFEQHTADPTCAGCHTLMDPIGFGFEAFDATGVFRDVDAGVAVDASGELIDTDVDGRFVGVRELAQRLLESHQVRRCVATQWFRFAFGRANSGEQDACTVDTLTDVLQTSGGNLHSLVLATVESETFRSLPRAGAQL